MGIIRDYVEPIISMGIGATQSILNPILQQKTNRENREWQEGQNAITRQREDNAHQREVADLQAAGLSPLANMSGAGVSTPLASEMDAPQIDTSAILDAMALQEQKREFDKDLEERKATRLQDADQREKDREITKDSIEASKEIAQENRKSAESINDKQLKLEVEKYNENQENLNITLEQANNDRNYESMKDLERQSEENYQNFSNTWGYLPTKQYTDLESYTKAKEEIDKFTSQVIKNLALSGDNQDPLTSASNSTSTGTGASGGVKFGGGVSAGANISTSQSNSWSTEPKIERTKITRRAFEDAFKQEKGESWDMLYPIFRATKKNTDKKYKKINWE